MNKTHDEIIASYSKIQEAHIYAKFQGEIYTPYIGISLVRSSGCFYNGNYFYYYFFSGGSGVLSEVNSGGDGRNFFFFYWWGGSEISGIPPHPPRYI